MAEYNQLILDNLARGAAKEGEVRANVGNPNQRLVWRGGKWEDAGAAPAGTNQMILDNVARGAAKEGEVRANVGNPGQALQWRTGADGIGRWESDNVPERGLMSAAPRVKYDNPSTGGTPSAKPAGAMSAPSGGTVDANYRTPLQSRLEGLANPFGDNYQQRLAAQGISNAERQYSQAADRTRAMLASRGLMSGGGTGLQASLMNQAAMEAAGARERALTGAATDTATRAADFEFRRAGAIDAYNRGLMSDAQALSLLPSQVALTQAQAQQAGTNARLADATFNDNVSQANIATSRAAADRDTARAQADIARVDAQIKALSPEQIAQMKEVAVQTALDNGLLKREEVKAAKQMIADMERKSVSDMPEWLKQTLRIGLPIAGAAGGFLLGGPVGALAGGGLAMSAASNLK